MVGGVNRQCSSGEIATIVKSAAVVSNQGNVPRSALARAHRRGEVCKVPIGWIAINRDWASCGFNVECMRWNNVRADRSDVTLTAVIPSNVNTAIQGGGKLAIPAPLRRVIRVRDGRCEHDWIG